MNISLGCVAAYGLWAGAVMLLGIGMVIDSLYVQNWGLALSAAAATASIRQYFVRQNRMMRNAFELGRDSATPLRPR